MKSFREWLNEEQFNKGVEVYYNNSKNINDKLNGEKFTILSKVGKGYKIGSNKINVVMTVDAKEIHLVQ